MFRTQIYLTEKERKGLKTLAHASGKKQSELIREAVDQLSEQSGKVHRENILKETAGMWRDRTDLPDPDELRKDWDRG